MGDREMVPGFRQTPRAQRLFRNFLRSEGGATAIEYALIASMIALAIVAGVQLTGTNLSTAYVEIGNALH
jgi:pilus assembly protein Flp/PilA